MSTESKPVLDADQLTEAERARHLRLLELRERVSQQSAGEALPDAADGADAADAAGQGPAASVSPEAAAAGGANQGEELNGFLKELVERRKSRHFQLQLIQDFFENPVEFGVEIDYVPSETPLSEIRSRQKELRYRVSLLRTVLEAFEGELSLLDQAERSALAGRSDAGQEEGTAPPAHSTSSAEASVPEAAAPGGDARTPDAPEKSSGAADAEAGSGPGGDARVSADPTARGEDRGSAGADSAGSGDGASTGACDRAGTRGEGR